MLFGWPTLGCHSLTGYLPGIGSSTLDVGSVADRLRAIMSSEALPELHRANFGDCRKNVQVAYDAIHYFTAWVPDGALEQEMKAHAEQLLTKCGATLAARRIRSRSFIRIGDNTAENIVELVEREHIGSRIPLRPAVSSVRRVACQRKCHLSRRDAANGEKH
jgi:hypothetical protein